LVSKVRKVQSVSKVFKVSKVTLVSKVLRVTLVPKVFKVYKARSVSKAPRASLELKVCKGFRAASDYRVLLVKRVKPYSLTTQTRSQVTWIQTLQTTEAVQQILAHGARVLHTITVT